MAETKRGRGRPKGSKNKNPRPRTEVRQLTLHADVWALVDQAQADFGLRRTEFFERAIFAYLDDDTEGVGREK